MDLAERLIFFAIGAGLGFICGYVVARLRVIETKMDAVGTEVHEVDMIVKRTRDDRGSFKIPPFTHIMMIVVLVITVFAAFSASKTNRNLENTVDCLTQYNTNQNKTLTSRDEAIQNETQAEIYLWTNYIALYDLGVESSPKELKRFQEEFRDSIVEYRDQLVGTQRTRNKHEYDHPDFLKHCEEKTR